MSASAHFAAPESRAPNILRPPARWSLLVAMWLLPLGLMLATVTPRDPVTLLPSWKVLVPQVAYWIVWPFLTPLIFELGRRFPLGSGRALAHIALHIVSSSGAGLLMGTYFVAMQWMATSSLMPTPAAALPVIAGIFAPFSALIYWLVLLVGRSLDGYRQSRERDALLAEVRLAALKAQVQPHFLFNSMNAISSLIDDDPVSAQRMLARLGVLLRASLHPTSDGHEVPLGEELDLLRLYLEIEQVRFGDRLSFSFDIDPAAQRARVPHLILQPLVENAIRHGIGRDSRAGQLRVEATGGGGRLRLRVSDDGPGPGIGPLREGIGLSNTRARLRGLYGDGAELRIRALEPRGTEVVVGLPLRNGLQERVA